MLFVAQHFLTPAPNLYRMKEVMGRGQAFFPDDPGYTMPDRNEIWSYLRDYHRTPGPAAYDPVHPNVRQLLILLTYSFLQRVSIALAMQSAVLAMIDSV